MENNKNFIDTQEYYTESLIEFIIFFFDKENISSLSLDLIFKKLNIPVHFKNLFFNEISHTQKQSETLNKIKQKNKLLKINNNFDIIIDELAIECSKIKKQMIPIKTFYFYNELFINNITYNDFFNFTNNKNYLFIKPIKFFILKKIQKKYQFFHVKNILDPNKIIDSYKKCNYYINNIQENIINLNKNIDYNNLKIKQINDEINLNNINKNSFIPEEYEFFISFYIKHLLNLNLSNIISSEILFLNYQLRYYKFLIVQNVDKKFFNQIKLNTDNIDYLLSILKKYNINCH